MIGYKVLTEAKKTFFDVKSIMKMMDDKTRKALSKFGAFVRHRARKSIVQTKEISKPGSPPSAHSGQIRLIFFGYDADRKSVVIGPILFSSAKNVPLEATVPHLLEEGGTISRVDRDGKTIILVYRPRPFMQPAFDAELPGAAAMFKE